MKKIKILGSICCSGCAAKAVSLIWVIFLNKTLYGIYNFIFRRVSGGEHDTTARSFYCSPNQLLKLSGKKKEKRECPPTREWSLLGQNNSAALSSSFPVCLPPPLLWPFCKIEKKGGVLFLLDGSERNDIIKQKQ